MTNVTGQTADQHDADRAARVRELFDAASDMDASRRAAYLGAQCGDDLSLRREVEELLRFAGPDDSFLKAPVIAASISSSHDSLIGQKLGAYAIKNLIAGGGMGSVYLAEQDTPRRTVALKVMTMGFWSESARRRFYHESQILGRFQHPHIAQVFEAGVLAPVKAVGESDDTPSRPIPFFAMEYVPDALPITTHADRHGCDIEERLRLFLQACDAVAYGHRRGVIHRDLKPANILVGSDDSQITGRESRAFVKLIDFGVARCTDSDVAATTMHTDAGQLIGTLAYMSPEQCDGDALNIDTRADVYALGVVLYELVCGQLPYDVSRTSIASAARTICESSPKPLNEAIKARRRIAGRPTRNIEAIILRTLEKNPAKRYDGAADLARDIRRWLNHEPIDARPLTLWNRALRWTIRHPVLSTTASCLAVVILVAAGTIISARAFYFQPYKIVLDGEANVYHAARLISRMGGTLAEWPEDSLPGERKVTDAALVDLPPALGGGKLAVVGYAEGAGGEYLNELCAYAIDNDIRNPVWHFQIDDEHVPLELLNKNRHGSDCRVRAILAADVFPEIEGDELIVSQWMGPFSQNAIRIHDLRGQLLYQVWQDGGVCSFRWLADSQRLICFGLDEAVKTRANHEFDTSIPGAFAFFAIEPKLGVISNHIMDPNHRGEPADAIWYHYLLPLRVGELEYEARMTGPFTQARMAAAQILINFAPDEDSEPGFSIPIDKNGNELLPSLSKDGSERQDYRVGNDLYIQRVKAGLLPPSNLFQISASPPTTSAKPD